MNKTQRSIIAIFLTLTLLSFFMTISFKMDASVLYFKFGLRGAMLATALSLLRRQREHLFITLAFFFTLVSDYFLVLAVGFTNQPPNRVMLGVLGFFLAYPTLILAFTRDLKFRRIDLAAISPFVLTYLIVLWFLLPYAKGPLFIAALILGVILCIYALTCVATLYRQVYTSRAARMIALAGILIFGGDMISAFSIFLPSLSGFVLWKDQVIWLIYVPGWTLYLAVMSEDNILKKEEFRTDEVPNQLLNKPLLGKQGMH